MISIYLFFYWFNYRIYLFDFVSNFNCDLCSFTNLGFIFPAKIHPVLKIFTVLSFSWPEKRQCMAWYFTLAHQNKYIDTKYKSMKSISLWKHCILTILESTVLQPQMILSRENKWSGQGRGLRVEGEGEGLFLWPNAKMAYIWLNLYLFHCSDSYWLYFIWSNCQPYLVMFFQICETRYEALICFHQRTSG